MMRRDKYHLLLWLTAIILLQPTAAYQASSSSTSCSRRGWIQAAAAFTGGVVTTLSTPPSQAASSKYCASGIGEGCDELSEGNALIKALQEKSAANKEKYLRDARDAYYMKNYPDWFATVDKVLIRKADGGYITVSNSELEQLKKDNKLRVEMPKAMGGKVVDMTQRPVLVLKE